MQYPESKWIDYICAQYEADRYIQQQDLTQQFAGRSRGSGFRY